MNISAELLKEAYESVKDKPEIKRLESLGVYQKAREAMDELSKSKSR